MYNKAAAKPQDLPKLTEDQSKTANEALETFDKTVNNLRSMNFIQKTLSNPDLTEQELKEMLYHAVDEWHDNEETHLELHQYLGMSWYDYADIIHDISSLKEILEKYKIKKTVKITLNSIKDPDEFGLLISNLSLPQEIIEKYFEFQEYASLELEIDEDLNIVGGKFLPNK